MQHNFAFFVNMIQKKLHHYEQNFYFVIDKNDHIQMINEYNIKNVQFCNPNVKDNIFIYYEDNDCKNIKIFSGDHNIIIFDNSINKINNLEIHCPYNDSLVYLGKNFSCDDDILFSLDNEHNIISGDDQTSKISDIVMLFAKKLFSAKYFEASLKLFLMVAHFDQTLSLNFEYLINALSELKNYTLALQICRLCIHLFPKNPIFIFKIGTICVKKELYHLARKYFLQYRHIAVKPIASILEYQSGVEIKLNNKQQALSYLEEYKQQSPHEYRPYFLLARFYLNENNLETAFANIELAKRHLKEMNYHVMNIYSEIFYRTFKWQQALDVVLDYLKNNAQDYQAYFLASRRFFAINDLQHAQEYVAKAIALASQIADFYLFAVKIALLQKNISQANAYAVELKKINFDQYLSTALNLIEATCLSYDAVMNYIVQDHTLLTSKEIAKLFLIALIHCEKVADYQDFVEHFLASCAEPEKTFFQYRLGQIKQSELPELSSLSAFEIKLIAKKFPTYINLNAMTDITLYQDEYFYCCIIEGIGTSVRDFTKINLPQKSYFFIQLNAYYTKKSLSNIIHVFFECTNNKYTLDNLIFLCNTEEQVKFAHELGLTKSFFCNHNCWIDWNIFTIKNLSKKYDMVMNCRPEKNMKRPYLAAQVQNLAIIRGNLVRQFDYFPLDTLQPKFINQQRLTPDEVVNILNQSYCGGIFSGREGACYSSSEYLLCGLPVISTQSEGGRDYWYDADNSIIVDADPVSVQKAVALAKDKLAKKEFQPEEIRKKHIQKSIELRKIFVKNLQQLLDENHILCDAQTIFDDKYTHLFKNVRPYPYSI